MKYRSSGRGHYNIPSDWDVEDCSARQHIILRQQDADLYRWATEEQDPTTEYSWTENIPTLDFNREMFAPGQNEKFPEGVVGIRTDDDFWSVAALPWKFQDLPLDVIVSTLWPRAADAKGYTIGYDRGPAADLSLQDRLKRLQERWITPRL
jgi:hypothetical protein